MDKLLMRKYTTPYTDAALILQLNLHSSSSNRIPADALAVLLSVCLNAPWPPLCSPNAFDANPSSYLKTVTFKLSVTASVQCILSPPPQERVHVASVGA